MRIRFRFKKSSQKEILPKKIILWLSAVCFSFAFFLGVPWSSFMEENPKPVKASSDESVLSVAPGKKIKFQYTDDNKNEDLIIKTDKETYHGISSSEVYFSVMNTGKKKETFELQAYFPENNGQVKKIEQWKDDIPYEAEVPFFGSNDYECTSKWQKKIENSAQNMSFPYYTCPTSKEKKACNELLGDDKICHIESEEVASRKEAGFKSDWKEINTQNEALKKKRSTVGDLLFKTHKNKEISRNFKVKKRTDDGVEIKSGETQYFRMEIVFSPYSSGEFYIEAIGSNGGYGLLDPWFDSGWQYRKSLTVNGTTAGALTDHQIEIDVRYGSGSDSGKNVYCSSNCKNDFGDIRFTASDGSTELDFWMKSYTAGDTAIFWVEVDSIPANPDSAIIYVYYGNASVSTASNGENTFAFFDDFSGDLSKWSIDAANTDKVAINSGALRHDPDSTQSRNSYSDTRVRTATYQIVDGIIEYDVYLAGTSSSSPRIIHQLGWRVQSLNFENGYSWRLQNSAADGGHMIFSNGSWSTFGTAHGAVTGNVWHSVKEVVSGSSYTAYVDGGSGYSGSNSTKLTAGYLISHVHGVSLGASSYLSLDNIRVRNYANPEITYGSWGTEELRPVDVSIILDSDGTVEYGIVASSQDTTSSGVNNTQTVRNNGNVAEDFDVRGADTTDWTLSSSGPGDAIYKHEWCTQTCDTAPAWNAFNTSYAGNYMGTNIAPDSTKDFDLKITVPNSNAGTSQQSAAVYIQATQH